MALTAIFAVISSTYCHSVIMHHKLDNQLFVKAGAQFEAVVKVVGLEQGVSVVQGTGTLIIDGTTNKTALITASHLFDEKETRKRRYFAQIGKEMVEIEKVIHFIDFLLQNYSNHSLIGLEIPQRQVFLSSKLSPHLTEDLRKSLISAGADLAICFIKSPLPDAIKPYKIAMQQDAFLHKTQEFWAVGFGEAGRGGSLFSFSQSFWGSGPKRAFQAKVKPEMSLTILNARKNVSERLITLSSHFEEKGFEKSLVGQVGSGDSGGPLLKKDEKTDTWHIHGVISANLPFAETENFKTLHPKTNALLSTVGAIAGKKSPFSNLLWKEANIYGSQGFYIDLTNSLVQKWIRSVFDQ
jgi:hypothetical protein